MEGLVTTNSSDTQDEAVKPKEGVYIKTFGCQMNEYDSEKMFTLLSKEYQPVLSPEEANVVIVNTCSVREKAEHKLFSLLGVLSNLKKENPDLIVGVSGCVAQQEGSSIIKRNKAVDFVVGTHNLSLVPGLVAQAKLGASPQVAVDYREEWENLPSEFDAYRPNTTIEQSPNMAAFGIGYNPTRALVSIQRGCSKHCSFCVVPTTRGPELSRNPEEILREIKLKVRLGAREVLLLGQTVNSFGKDLSPRYPFHRLIREIAEIENLKRIRFISPHPAEVKKEFIDLYAEVPKLCSHIHLPLQSGSNRILKLMNRNYRKERYLEIVEQIKEKAPEVAITTDIIIGFPTETEEDFEETLNVLKQVQFALAYSFKYSRRPNTTAIESFDEKEEVPGVIASNRLERLQVVQNEIGKRHNDRYQGKIVEVLIEGQSKLSPERMSGRSPQNVLVEIADASPKVGDIVQVEVQHAGPYGLRGILAVGVTS